MKIGVLAFQGGVIEHLKHLKALGVEPIEVKKAADLEGLQGIILPGGESTTIGKLLRDTHLFEPLHKKINSGLAVWGTCAGMILLAKNIQNDTRTHLAVMDIEVRRNAFGSQIDSFRVQESVEGISSDTIPLVFIRAPYIVKVGRDVQILHEFNGNIVAAREKNMLVTSFHPELTDNLEFHRYFISMCS
ncbi:pyridoxal 5'-phosphate synthase glutaminase subunit PdxT [Clostridium sp. 19966]|uniref:pyridoxal 5'-phosphate synthase glutaminase subunit PdxT n=1 Tax=Clostridium sp. 19966 TaxID=2768166 RepID=UPI0028DDCAD0|nr:pyridoxal 5'-phosphate synthase glutaminase subunit PdxT [Clostridium sp. 19966]MDT8718896.1 pyridoxal 5'-phosphate synthase glutaminase subunit PdxT [Clostridium sp. 19966]